MTFWQFDASEPGQSYDYPALGFTAIDGAILDGDASTPKITKAPGPEWSVVASGPESGITRQAEPSYDPDYVEPSDGSLLVYSDQANSHVNMSPADFIQGPAAGSLNSAIAERGGQVAARGDRGAVCFTWDDGYPSWRTLIAPFAETLGQRHTFCVTTSRIDAGDFGMSNADILGWFNDGHEIASHSVTHPNISSLTQAQRVTEYDNSKAALEAIVGAGNVTTWVYPYGGPTARNAQTDAELYGRYDRVRITGPTGLYRNDGRYPFLICSYPVSHSGIGIAKEMIRLAAKMPVTVVLFGHSLANEAVQASEIVADSPTQQDVTDLLNLAHDLDVPCIPLREAFPSRALPANFGFERGLDGWTDGSVGTGKVVETVTATPDAGMPGTKVLHLVKTTNDTQQVAARQIVPVVPGESYVFSGRIKVNTGPTNIPDAGYWAARLKIEYLSGADLTTTTTGPSTVSPAAANYGTWQKVATAAWTAPAGIRFAQLTCVVQIGAVDQAPLPDVYFDHLAFEPQANGDHG